VKQLKALETLTEVPASKLSAWLTRHGKALLAEPKPALNRAKVLSIAEELYFVRCLKSGFRYRPRKSDSDEPKVFECTNDCGQLFCRKGDWGRHERVNFEEWLCPHCGKVLTRCEHLRAHFRDAHPVEKDISKYQKREFLTARQRPCGFCGSTLTDWSAWLAHVANHFEERREGGGRAMSYWTEYRSLDKTEAEIVVTAPDETMLGTMAALETQSDHATSPALWHAAETLEEQHKKDERSARQDKDDGKDGDLHGQIGNHYNDSEPHIAIGPNISTKVQSGTNIGRAPSSRYGQSYDLTYGHAGRHNPERQASLYQGPSRTTSSGFLSSVACGRHPNTGRHKAELTDYDSLGHRSTLHKRYEDTDDPTIMSDLFGYLPTEYESSLLGSSRHARHSTPLQAGRAERSGGLESSYDELAGMYGGLSIRDTGPESAEPYHHRHERELREPRHPRNERERYRYENSFRRPDNRQRNEVKRYHDEDDRRHWGNERYRCENDPRRCENRQGNLRERYRYEDDRRYLRDGRERYR
jgi:hypothetical protein